MDILVIGGTGFLGRALVSAALATGAEVCTLNRGRRAAADPRVRAHLADRTDATTFAGLPDVTWDVVIDTWAGAPSVVNASATALIDRTRCYTYISSRAVYRDPTARGLDESWPTVRADPDGEATAYGVDKRGAELAVTRALPGRALLARSGLILGPGEDMGRLPTWLDRGAQGGDLLAPGPSDLPWRMVDVRDLADWVVTASLAGATGPVNLVNPVEHATTTDLLDAVCEVTAAGARPVWVSPQALADAGIERWASLPGWVPPGAGIDGLLWTDDSRARATGLRCRPVADTVRDTWEWMQRTPDVALGPPGQLPYTLDPAAVARAFSVSMVDD